MKIVVADPVPMNEKYKRKLGTFGELEVFDGMPASANDYAERVKDAEILLVGKDFVSRDVFQHAGNLKMICVCHTGYDNVDLEAATARGIIVSNVPNYASEAVAEFVFAVALDLLRKIEVADVMAHKGEFDDHYYVHNRLLAGKTIGVIGAGDIGRRVMQIAHTFNMNVISTTAHPSSEREAELGVRFVPLDNLLTESDIITLHVPLSPKTKHMIDIRELKLLKPTAILINTSRGKIINEDALIEILRNEAIAGAALDVFEKETLKADSPMMKLENLVLTPHIAYLSEETTDKCASIVTENVEMFLKGNPQNVVNPGVLGKGQQQS